jgi:transposase InsO family protein
VARRALPGHEARDIGLSRPLNGGIGLLVTGYAIMFAGGQRAHDHEGDAVRGAGPVGTARFTADDSTRPGTAIQVDEGERFGDFRFLIRDRGSNFTESFDAVFQATGTTILHTAVQAPRMKAICERLVGTVRREVLDWTLILNQAHLRAVLAEYQEHYNTAPPHQGIGQRIPDPGPGPRVTAADPARGRSAENQS